MAALPGGRDKGEASGVGPLPHPFHNGLPSFISQRLPQLLAGAGAKLVCSQIVLQARDEDIGAVTLQEQR